MIYDANVLVRCTLFNNLFKWAFDVAICVTQYTVYLKYDKVKNVILTTGKN